MLREKSQFPEPCCPELPENLRGPDQLSSGNHVLNIVQIHMAAVPDSGTGYQLAFNFSWLRFNSYR